MTTGLGSASMLALRDMAAVAPMLLSFRQQSISGPLRGLCVFLDAVSPGTIKPVWIPYFRERNNQPTMAFRSRGLWKSGTSVTMRCLQDRVNCAAKLRNCG